MRDMFETHSFDILKVNQLRVANARTIGLRGVSVPEWLCNNVRMRSWWPIGCVMITHHSWEYSVFETSCQDVRSWRSLHGMSNARCELCILGDELKQMRWGKLQYDVAIVWFKKGIIICLYCCVMILVNLCHNGLSMMYAQVAHTRWPRETLWCVDFDYEMSVSDYCLQLIWLVWCLIPTRKIEQMVSLAWIGLCSYCFSQRKVFEPKPLPIDWEYVWVRRLSQGFELRAL